MHDHRIGRELRESRDIERKAKRSLAHWLWPWHWTTVRDTGVNVYLECPCGERTVRSRPAVGHQPIDRHWLETGSWHVIDWSKVRLPTAPSAVWRPPRDH